MDYINAPGTVTDAEGRPQFADKVPGSVQGTDLCAAVFNPTVNELVAAIVASGQTRSAANEAQLALAIRLIALVQPFSEAVVAGGGYGLNALVADPATIGMLWISTAANNTTTPNTTDAAWERFGWNQFIKQGWGFSNFGNNQIYLGWREDGSGLGLGIDSTDQGTIALLTDVIKQGLSDGTLARGNQVSIGLRTGVTSGAARIGAKVDDTDFGNFAMTGNKTLGLGDWTEQYYTLASGGSKTISLEFDAPLDGYVLVVGSANYSVQNTNQTNLTISVNGTNLSADQVTGSTSMTNHSCVKVSAGPVTVGSYCGTSATNPPNVGHTLSYLYIPA